MSPFLLPIVFLTTFTFAAHQNHYLLGTRGWGSGLSIANKRRGAFIGAKKTFYGLGYQAPFRSQTLFDITFSWHNAINNVPYEYFPLSKVSPIVGCEISLKKPMFAINMMHYSKIKIYGKGGLLETVNLLYQPVKDAAFLKEPVWCHKFLVGVGAQSELFSSLLVDVSVNQLFSFSSGASWYIRVTIGPRLPDSLIKSR